MRLFDAHAHLAAAPPGEGLWVVPGVNAERDAAAPRGAGIWRAVGLHPWYLGDEAQLDTELTALRERVDDDVIAIGETGLDAMRRAGPRDRQERAFSAQIELAMERQLPLILHVVRRHGVCLEMLKTAGFPVDLGGMVHDFGGPAEVVTEWVRAGFALSISPRSVDAAKQEARRAMVAAIPAEALLVETDDFGAERLGEVVRWVAQARGAEESAIASLTGRNARRLFGLPSGVE